MYKILTIGGSGTSSFSLTAASAASEGYYIKVVCKLLIYSLQQERVQGNEAREEGVEDTGEAAEVEEAVVARGEGEEVETAVTDVIVDLTLSATLTSS